MAKTPKPAPAEDRYRARMEELLRLAGTLGPNETLPADGIVDAVSDFQRSHGLFVDGDAGQETLWALQLPWALLETNRLTLVACEADIAKGSSGAKTLRLRSDAAAAYGRVRATIRKAGGLVTTAGGLRPLSSGASASRSALSMHYPAIAFDLATDAGSGYANPAKDAYVVVRTAGTGADTWQVHARAADGENQTLRGSAWGGRDTQPDPTTKVTGSFVSFTQAAIAEGFRPIGPRPLFLADRNRDYMSAEWWHFQYEDALIPNLSQLGIELLRIEGYGQQRIAAENPTLWDNRKAVFRKRWF